jgi:hypothetical protein
MKTPALVRFCQEFRARLTLAALTLLCEATGLQAQIHPPAPQSLPPPPPTPVEVSPFTAVERGPHHARLQQVSVVTNGARVFYQTNSYTEIATGLNHLVRDQWVPSSEQIDITTTVAE